ncbi:hypothetical protein JOD67_006925 [Tenggerimyces flavus]|nr:hypothetical protein [Tenggerimyces flavus]
MSLTAAEWWTKTSGWQPGPAGSVRHHGTFVEHAMRAGDQPLLAIYVWRGEEFIPSTWAPR